MTFEERMMISYDAWVLRLLTLMRKSVLMERQTICDDGMQEYNVQLLHASNNGDGFVFLPIRV